MSVWMTETPIKRGRLFGLLLKRQRSWGGEGGAVVLELPPLCSLILTSSANEDVWLRLNLIRMIFSMPATSGQRQTDGELMS